jgi:FkbM family methyltransferase
MEKIKRLVKLFLIFIKVKNFKYARLLSRLRGGTNVNFCNKFTLVDNMLHYKNTARFISINNLFIFNYDLTQLTEAFEKHFLEQKENSLYVHINKNQHELTLEITSYDSLGAFTEIFGNHVYDTVINDDLLVIDVGMNIGTASLSFASFKNVKKVFGFEPIQDTCLLAKKNFELNGIIGEKIKYTCAALGRGDKQILIPKPCGGSVGVTITDFMQSDFTNKQHQDLLIEIEVKDAYSAISEILDLNKEKALLKLDCEGAEYEIVEDLFEKQLLHKISIIIIEWHIKDKSILIEKLNKAGFIMFTPNIQAKMPVGLIYGINKKLCCI